MSFEDKAEALIGRLQPGDAAKAIETLTGVLDFYDGGRRWTQGHALREGRRCLISALICIAGEHDAGFAEDARRYLCAALASFWHGRQVCDVDLIGYNDESDGYEEVHALLLEALALALARAEQFDTKTDVSA
jgi:hypothetical protein